MNGTAPAVASIQNMPSTIRSMVASIAVSFDRGSFSSRYTWGSPNENIPESRLTNRAY